jgi:hypothetical protein
MSPTSSRIDQLGPAVRALTGTESEHLVRVRIPDQVGGLAALAGLIARIGGDVVSVEVVEREPPWVVDDLVVLLTPERRTELIAAAADAGLAVETARPYSGPADLGPDLDLVDALVSTSAPTIALVCGVAAASFKASWAVVLESGPSEVSTGQGTPGAPRLRWSGLDWLPLTTPVALDVEADWVPGSWSAGGSALAAAPLAGTDRVLLVSRTGGPSFRSAEVHRLGQLGLLAGSLTERPDLQAPGQPPDR